MPDGGTLSSVSVSVQDRADGWSGRGEARSAGEVKIVRDFNVFNAAGNISLKPNDVFEASIIADTEIASVAWLKDGKVIKSGAESSISIIGLSAKDAGVYSAVVTSESEISKTVPIAVVEIV